MHNRDGVELTLVAPEEGWARVAAGALVGASGPTVSRWASGALGWRTPDESRRLLGYAV